MGIFKKIEELLFTGKVIKDYGIICEDSTGCCKRIKTVLLVDRKGQKKIIIRESRKALLAASITYSEFDRTGVQQLRDSLDDALNLM